MSLVSKPWDGEQVRQWLASRIEAARLDQAAADKRGYDSRDDFDKAAAEEWVCQRLTAPAATADQAAFAARLTQMLAQDEYRVAGIYDDRRFEKHVRATLRKLSKMAKANAGFENRLRFQ